MSPLELLAPETVDAIPFSIRLAERRRTGRAAAAPTDRRAHLRRSARELEWLRAVRLTGGTGYDARLVDLSEGGALIEVDAPLRPGVTLTLELTGPELQAVVPLEVLRCYIASLRGDTAIYRGACAFAHLIELPGQARRSAPAFAAEPAAPAAANFVGTEAALTYLLERCASPETTPGCGGAGISLARTEVIHVLDALKSRTSARGSDLLSRYTSDLLSAILPALHDGAPRDVAVHALDARMRGLPRRWQSLLQPTIGRLAALIEHCGSAAAAPAALPAGDRSRVLANVAATDVDDIIAAVPAVVPEAAPGGQIDSAFQKIVVRHGDGKILKGYTQDFHPSRPQFSLWPAINAAPKDRVVVPFARLKAVFFVRDFNGNPAYRERKTFGVKGQGRRVEVTFSDGETVLGTTLSYRPDGQGFFVSPADPAGNNTRVFVITSAVRRVRFL